MESEEFQGVIPSMLIRCAVLLTGRHSREVGRETNCVLVAGQTNFRENSE